MPSYSSLATQMGAKDVYNGNYKYQSKFTHSSRLSLRVLYNINTKNMSITPIYDESLFLLCAESLVRVSVKMAEYIGRVLIYLDTNKAEYWDKENSQRFKDAINWLEELREKYGNVVKTPTKIELNPGIYL